MIPTRLRRRARSGCRIESAGRASIRRCRTIPGRRPKPMRSHDGTLSIGLIGGMSWESTVPYYRVINETVREQRGGLHSARIVLYSVDFHDVEAMQRTGRWSDAGEALALAAVTLEGAGADFVVLCTNTMHKVAAA